MANTTVSSGQDAVVSEIDIAVPIARIFQALIDPKQLMRWFKNDACPAKTWEMDARPGGKYWYDTEKSSTVVVNGVSEFECHGEILEIDPPRLIVYTWIANWHDDKERKTTVRWELEVRGSGTHVRVTHSGLVEESTARKDYAGGWPGVLEGLKKFVER